MDTAVGSGNKIIKTYNVSVTYKIFFTRFVRYKMPLFSVYLQHMYMCQILYFLWDPPPKQKQKKTELKRDREYLKNH